MYNRLDEKEIVCIDFEISGLDRNASLNEANSPYANHSSDLSNPIRF